MATIEEFIVEIIEKNVDSWLTSAMDEESHKPEDTEERTEDDYEDDDEAISDIIAKLVDAVLGGDGDGDDAVLPVEEPSDAPGITGQGDLLQAGDVSNKADETAEGEFLEEEIGDGKKLDRPKSPETTTQKKSKSSRGRSRRIAAAAWRGAKRLFLCGCCRAE